MEHSTERASGLRVVAFSVLPMAYSLIRSWAEAHGHEIVLLVTSPGPLSDRSEAYHRIISQAPPGQEILVTTRPRKAIAAIASWNPDLIVAVNFPHLVPMELVRLSKLGGVNLHAAPLPRYRGPNPLRMIYDGNSVVGATLHRLDPTFDSGPILSVCWKEVSEPFCVASVWEALSEALLTAFYEGMQRCIDGEAGEAQSAGDGSYAALFREEEFSLDWRLPSQILVRRCVAVNLLSPQARALIDGVVHKVIDISVVDHDSREGAPGTVLSYTNDGALIRTGDGAVAVRLLPMQP